MNKITAYSQMLVLVLSAVFTTRATAADGDKAVRDQNITVISAKSTADGKSEVRDELLEACIVSLPKTEALEAEITSKPRYLKEVNGAPESNGFMQTYSARLEINYILRQKTLIIITTSSVQNQEPVIKVVEKNLPQKREFTSNSAEGDIFAGRSRRLYYFSKPELAVSDAKKRAAIWLKQQEAVVCRDE